MDKYLGSGRRMNGYWLVLAAAVLWGTTGTAQAFAPAGAHPVQIGAMRLAVGGAALLLLAILRGVLRWGEFWPFLPTIFAAGGIAAYQLSFFAAVARTGVAVGTIVTIGSGPIFAGVLNMAIGRDRPGGRWLMATALAILGCGFLVTGGKNISVDRIGILLSLFAGGAYALHAIAAKRLLEVHTPEAVMAVVFCLGAIFLLPWLILADLSWLLESSGLLVTLHLGLIATALAYTLFARGLRLIPVTTAVTLSLAEPLTAAGLGILLLREALTLPVAVGAGLLLAGLSVLTFGDMTITRRLTHDQI